MASWAHLGGIVVLFLAARIVASIMQKHSYGTQNNSETSDSALLFETHNLLVRCLVPPAQLLEVNVFDEGGEAAMRRVQTFVNSTSSAGGRPIPSFFI